MSVLQNPIIVIGAARSGTHLLGSFISEHKDIAYISEQNYVWKYSNAWLGHDMIPASRATPEIVKYIRREFADMCENPGKKRICEKTPANSLRLPFIMSVFSDAKIIHIVRDGRDVAVSARKKFEGNLAKITRNQAKSKVVTRKRIRSGFGSRAKNIMNRTAYRLETGIPARDFFYYLRDFIDYLLVQMNIRTFSVWGPRIPGIRHLLKSHSLIEVCAIQWRTCVEHVLNYSANHPGMDFLQLRYEDLCNDPIRTFKDVFDFCELSFPDTAKKRLSEILPYSPSYKQDMTPMELELVHDQISNTLEALGYEL